MNKFFKSASNRFTKIREKEYLISPLSEVDCEIIVELGQIIKKTGLDDVVGILKTYKEEKDEDIRDKLLQWNIDNPKTRVISNKEKAIVTEMEEEVTKYPPFLKIKDLIIRIYDLKGLELYERFNKDEGQYMYGIIINPTPQDAKSIPLYANHKIEFHDDEYRNDVLEKLKEVMADNNTEFIDLT